MTAHEMVIEQTAEVVRLQLAIVGMLGPEAVEEVLRKADLSTRPQGVQSTVQSPRTHLEAALKLVDDFTLTSETRDGNHDSVEAAVCLRRRIREALSYWSTLEALRQKQGR